MRNMILNVAGATANSADHAYARKQIPKMCTNATGQKLPQCAEIHQYIHRLDLQGDSALENKRESDKYIMLIYILKFTNLLSC